MSTLRGSYYNKLDEKSLAVLDLCPYGCAGYIITRINVPKAHRRKGYGTQLMKELFLDADRGRWDLFLVVNEYGSMSHDDLVKWYNKLGFEGDGDCMMVRRWVPLQLNGNGKH